MPAPCKRIREDVEMLPVREFACEEEICCLFIAEPPLFLLMSDKVSYVIAAVI